MSVLRPLTVIVAIASAAGACGADRGGGLRDTATIQGPRDGGASSGIRPREPMDRSDGDAPSGEDGGSSAQASGYTTLADACAAVVDPEPPSTCEVEPLTAQGASSDVAILRLTAWEKRFVRLAARIGSRWHVASCDAMVDTSVDWLFTVVDDVRGATASERGAALRYVRHAQRLEPPEVGAGQQGGGALLLSEFSVYEDHLVTFDVASGACSDVTAFSESPPARTVPDAARGRHAPPSFRAATKLVHEPGRGFRLE